MVVCLGFLAVKLFHQPGKPAGVNITESDYVKSQGRGQSGGEDAKMF